MALAMELDDGAAFFLDPDARWTLELDSAGLEYFVEDSIHSTDSVKKAVISGDIHGVVFDSYDLTPQSIEDIAKWTFTVEIADTSRVSNAHAIVVPSLSKLNHPIDRKTENQLFLVGPRFTLLTANFAKTHKREKERVTPPDSTQVDLQSVLISMGAYDSVNATGFILEALESIDAQYDISVVLGKNAPHIKNVETQMNLMTKNVKLLVEADLSQLLPENDLIITAGGVTLLEATCCGTPAITIPFAENQVASARVVDNLGIGVFGGKLSQLTVEDLASRIGEVTRDSAARQRMRNNGLSLIDGQGAKRVANAIYGAREEHHVH